MYLETQLSLCAIMGTIGWAIAYFFFGSYALLLGLWVGATEIAPVPGPFPGAIPAVLIALFPDGFMQALLVALLFLLAQRLEGNVLVPRIMGSSVGVHPLWVLFVTLAVKALYGAVFAVTIVVVGATLLRYLSKTLLFEDRRKTLATEIFLQEDKSGTAAAGEELAELRGSCGVGG